MTHRNEKAHESIVFGLTILLAFLIVCAAKFSGVGKEADFYPTSQGRDSAAGAPVRTPANLPLGFDSK